MPHEFRVRWQREGRGQGSRVYQTWAAAYKKFCTIKCWDEVKEDTRYENMPDLKYVVLESREVPEWAPHDFQPKVSDLYRQRTREGILRGEPDHEPEPEGASEIPF
jgi:hypothetical protein